MAACRRAVMRWANRCTATHSLPPGRAARGMGGGGGLGYWWWLWVVLVS